MNERGAVGVWILWFIVSSVFGLGALIGIGCAIGANTCLFGDREPFTTTDGAMIFDVKCALCHGPAGEGGAGPSLVSGSSTELTFEELQAKIARGRPFAGMPRFEGELSQEQIEAVARYVSTQLRGENP